MCFLALGLAAAVIPNICSYVGEVHVNIPLYALFARPITATIEDIVLVLETQPINQWNPEQFKTQFLNLKTASLASGETAALASAYENGLLWRLGMRIAGNVRVKIKNVHIRFEDRVSRSGRPFSVGEISVLLSRSFVR